MEFLFEIEDVFEIRGYRNIIAPGIPYSYPNSIGVGAKIAIETPDGLLIETTIAGFEMISRREKMEHAPFSIPKGIKKAQLPIGSKVYLVTQDAGAF
jgi:hypothetical protein